jgi:hypothetical protein
VPWTSKVLEESFGRLDSEVAQIIFQKMFEIEHFGCFISNFILPDFHGKPHGVAMKRERRNKRARDLSFSPNLQVLPRTALGIPSNPFSEPAHHFGLSIFYFGGVKTTTVPEISSVHIFSHGSHA